MHRWEQQSSSGTHGALAGDRDIAGEESCIWWWLRRGRCLWQAMRSFCSSGMHTSDFVLLGEKSLLWPQYRKVHPKLLLLLMCLALTWSQGGPFLQAPAQKRPVAVNSCIVIRGNNFGLPPLFMQQGWIWLLFVATRPNATKLVPLSRNPSFTSVSLLGSLCAGCRSQQMGTSAP